MTDTHVVEAISPESAPAKPRAVRTEKLSGKILHVLDTTARPDSVASDGRPVSGSRTHLMLVEGMEKPFTFKAGEPLAIPAAVAYQFLRHPEFKLTDRDGNLLQFQRQPKQPAELQAGEKLVLKEDETIARFDELSTKALQHRALEIPGSDKFGAENPSRDAMIAFIVSRTVKVKQEKKAKEPDVTDEEFVPVSDLDEEAA